jgi:hypothetical protein
MIIESLVRTVVTGVVTLLVVGGLRRVLARAGRDRVSLTQGHITPSKPLTLTVTAIGGLIAAAAFYATLTDPDSFPAVLVGLAALLLAAATATGLMPVYDIYWNEHGVEGPASLLFPPFGPKRDYIAWSDVTDAGRDPLGNWFVADAAGNRIRWNYIYSGYAYLMAAVETQCPQAFRELHPAE